MPRQPRKMSEIMKEMAESLLTNPEADHSSEAMHAALFFANVAWNECLGLNHSRDGYGTVWRQFEDENPKLWDEFKSNDIDAMLDELVKFKKRKYPKDMRRILTCGIPDGKIRVEWLHPVAPGVDSRWEMQLYGLVRTGERDEAIQFLRKTRRMSPMMAAMKVTEVAIKLGLK